ncbi:polysaccharide pyruvyl transferase family protein [Arthrobacter sp. CJ23]|uniref:polysaccharide pyruvyl transferase family protein n=1 Tax=Arthrobacter sp. CJ23 TaxID=2972479 RepID=UPI00215BB031|nr:polysaccharide pyruvyl transferase family protein [Arthrobacter sp. CJ23]UVJ38738.1 polysaccharide pyruvyl transferase family protein [Arthrobacter sp. CJ23]
MKALVLWADEESPNLGVRVLAKGMEVLLKRAFPGITVDSLADATNDDGVGLSGRHLAKELVGARGPLASFIKRYDVVVDIGGGDSFSDIYGLKRLALMRHVHLLCRRTGVPLIIGPQTIGPFSSRAAKWMGRSMLRSSAMSVARDSKSAEYSSAIGAPVSVTATDVVFALDRPLQEPRKGVVVNVSGLLWDSSRHGDSSSYRTSVQKLVDQLLADGRSVSFLAHVLDSPSADNDCRIFPSLQELYGSDATYIIPRGLVHVRQILASAEVVVGSRMHACLNGLSVGTPAIAWAYSRKFAPLLDDLGWNQVVDLATSKDPVAATLDYMDVKDTSRQIAALNERAEVKLGAVVEGLQMGWT